MHHLVGGPRAREASGNFALTGEWSPCKVSSLQGCGVGIVELCAKILQIMRNDFKDYARTFFKPATGNI